MSSVPELDVSEYNPTPTPSPPSTPSPAQPELPSAATKDRQKLQGKSAVHAGLEKLEKSKGERTGLFRFFGRATAEEYRAQVARATEETETLLERDRDLEDNLRQLETQRRKDAQNKRQREHRARIRATKDAGANTARGVKRSLDALHDTLEGAETKRQKQEFAEATRPKRAIRAALHTKSRKPQGRKSTKLKTRAIYVNWHTPLLWGQIMKAASDPSVGWTMSTTAIKKVLMQRSPESFAKLNRSTIEGWIDRSGPKPKWSDSSLQMAEKGHSQGGHAAGARGALAAHPDVVKSIIARLEALRNAGTPLTLVSVRGIVVATITAMAPEIFERKARDGSTFRCSDSFLRQFLHGSLHWSERRATRDGHKLPLDWEALCMKAFLRLVHDVKEYNVPSELYINTDQTNMIYAQGTKLTWAPTGSKQVGVVGTEEKRAVTLCVSVANSGVLLPFQAVYQGETYRSTPTATAPHYKDTVNAGMHYEYGSKKTYWSTQRTMQRLVDTIIVPYLEEQKKKLPDLPPNQNSIWQIDVWSVHRSKEFRDWMKEHHTDILLHFVPAGCTPVFQACDVGIQRILKHSLKRSYHRDVVNEVLAQLDDGKDVITIAKAVGVLRDRTVGWVWNAYNTLNHEHIVKKVSFDDDL